MLAFLVSAKDKAMNSTVIQIFLGVVIASLFFIPVTCESNRHKETREKLDACIERAAQLDAEAEQRIAESQRIAKEAESARAASHAEFIAIQGQIHDETEKRETEAKQTLFDGVNDDWSLHAVPDGVRNMLGDGAHGLRSGD